MQSLRTLIKNLRKIESTFVDSILNRISREKSPSLNSLNESWGAEHWNNRRTGIESPSLGNHPGPDPFHYPPCPNLSMIRPIFVINLVPYSTFSSWLSNSDVRFWTFIPRPTFESVVYIYNHVISFSSIGYLGKFHSPFLSGLWQIFEENFRLICTWKAEELV